MMSTSIQGECQWFHGCHNESMAIVEHPTIGDVQICDEHVEWLFEDAHEGMVNPTKLVPPTVARHMGKIESIFAGLEDDDDGEA